MILAKTAMPIPTDTDEVRALIAELPPRCEGCGELSETLSGILTMVIHLGKTQTAVCVVIVVLALIGLAVGVARLDFGDVLFSVVVLSAILLFTAPHK